MFSVSFFLVSGDAGSGFAPRQFPGSSLYASFLFLNKFH
jgi:hypothetical protein